MQIRHMLAALAIAVPASAGLADSGPSYGPAIGMAEAQRLTAAAIDEARRTNLRLAVAVVDPHGFLVYFARMDDTQTAGVNVAIEKAKTAAMFRRPSRAFEEAVAKRPAIIGLPGAMPIIGGVPIVVDGKIVGAVGASGAAAEEDEATLKAALQAWAKR